MESCRLIKCLFSSPSSSSTLLEWLTSMQRKLAAALLCQSTLSGPSSLRTSSATRPSSTAHSQAPSQQTALSEVAPDATKTDTLIGSCRSEKSPCFFFQGGALPH